MVVNIKAMTDSKLSTLIDSAWGKLGQVDPAGNLAAARQRRTGDARAGYRAAARGAAIGPELGRQRMGEEGNSAIVSPERQYADGGRVRQGAAEIRELGRGRFCQRQIPRRTGRDRAPRCVYRAGCRVDAKLRQYRRLCRREHDDRQLCDGGEAAHKSAPAAISRAGL